jgi:hypothetical protein
VFTSENGKGTVGMLQAMPRSDVEVVAPFTVLVLSGTVAQKVTDAIVRRGGG